MTELRATAVPDSAILTRALALIYLLVIATAVLIPDPRAVGTFKYNLGTPFRQLGGLFAEVSATTLGDVIGNVAGFIPLTVLLCLGWRRVRGWVWGACATLLSVAAETAQYLLPITRRADLWNVVENSAGAWIGVLLVSLLPGSAAGRGHSQRPE